MQSTPPENHFKGNSGHRCLPGSLALALALCPGVAGCGGAGMTKTPVAVEQPIDFQHKSHVAYFSSGKHREEKVRMHIDLVGFEEAPQEILDGECEACHTDLPERKACAGCHLLFQNEKLRSQRDLRACVACHRQTWIGHTAGIPSINVCGSCHGDQPLTGTAEERRLRAFLQRGEDIPWIQIHALDSNVHFSHKAHVRYRSIECTHCHESVLDMTSPPALATVFSMRGCMQCHEQNHAGNDCLDCHK